MQPITFLSTASAMIATVSAAATAAELMQDFKPHKAYARVINRCDYDVHLWSILHGDGCPTEGMVTLKKGEIYNENYRESEDKKTGVAIKVSKTKECKGKDIVQLEYFLQRDQPGFNFNYLDVSYVDCLTDDCPTKQEGYYLQAGSQSGEAKASASNTWCPVLSCDDPISCAKMSYILPDDVQTKTCDPEQSMDWYMCGGNAPTEDYESTPEAPKSSAQPSYESSAESSAAPTASSTEEAEYSAAAPTPSEDTTANSEAATVTSAPEPKESENANGLTKTQVVYVTQYEYVNAKRHAHDHARRHQPFHA